MQAVKEVLQALVDDDLVRFEKIGASNYYWSFPSEASLRLENEAKKAATDLALLQKRKVELAARISEQKQGKEDSVRCDAVTSFFAVTPCANLYRIVMAAPCQWETAPYAHCFAACSRNLAVKYHTL